VLERPRAAKVNPADAVAPGRHRPHTGDHEVVWWDPRALELGKHVSVGLRQTRILEADRSSEVAEAGRAAYLDWQRGREERIAQGSIPSLEVRSVTALAEAEPLGPAELALVSCLEVAGDRTARPHGARFGTLVHATLSLVDLDGDPHHIGAIAAAQAKLINSSEEEVRAATDAVDAALRHPVLRQAARAERCHREAPIVLRRADRSLADGVIDLVFRSEDAGEPVWTIVDFKTDRDPALRRATYAAQVRLYVEAVAAATGEKAQGVLLAV
jgi:ATP-dependent exoDNAse (exonuclease V) beta subunit